METHIASRSSEGIHHCLTPPGPGPAWKDCRALAGNNFSNSGVDRKVRYHRPATKRVAPSRNKTFFLGASLVPAPARDSALLRFQAAPARTRPVYTIILLIKLFDVTNECC
jgi:hypothetical protein